MYRRYPTLVIAGSVVNFEDSSVCQGRTVAKITPSVMGVGQSQIACSNSGQNRLGVSKMLINK